MTNLDKRYLTFGEIADMQDLLNAKADRKNPEWRQVRTRGDFLLAAVLELSELIESAPWKWWKKAGEADWWNIKIEAIDMLHFMASASILAGIPESEAVDRVGFGSEEESSTKIFLGSGSNLVIDRDYAVSLFARILAEGQSLAVIDEVMKSVGLSSDEIGAIYLAKYTLNEIRWAGGYDDGTYQKMKAGGVEDNVFLKEVVDRFLADATLTLADIPILVRKTMGDLS